MPALVKFTGYKSHARGKGGIRAMSRHLRYIEADRERKDGSKVHERPPELFNESGRISRQEFMELLKNQPERGVIAHKAVLSLSQDEADRQGIDIGKWVRNVVSRLEIQVGRKFNWCAAIHQDKGHPHAHLVIAGRDTDNKELFFRDKDIKRLQKIADEERAAQHARNLTRGDLNQERDWVKELEEEKAYELFGKQLQRTRGYER